MAHCRCAAIFRLNANRKANAVVPIDGELYTPPVESGLLAGTFRGQLLAEGKIKERVITIEELQEVKDFFLINSVRKWMKVFCVLSCAFLGL